MPPVAVVSPPAPTARVGSPARMTPPKFVSETDRAASSWLTVTRSVPPSSTTSSSPSGITPQSQLAVDARQSPGFGLVHWHVAADAGAAENTPTPASAVNRNSTRRLIIRRYPGWSALTTAAPAFHEIGSEPPGRTGVRREINGVLESTLGVRGDSADR